MTLRIVRLGSPRSTDEGLRLGTVRRPPRGVPKTEFASRDYYDIWLPLLSPSAELMKLGHAALAADDVPAWQDFARRFSAEMNEGEAPRVLDLLAALSHQTNLALGCYCEDEARCHRGILRGLLEARGASLNCD